MSQILPIILNMVISIIYTLIRVIVGENHHHHYYSYQYHHHYHHQNLHRYQILIEIVSICIFSLVLIEHANTMQKGISLTRVTFYIKQNFRSRPERPGASSSNRSSNYTDKVWSWYDTIRNIAAGRLRTYANRRAKDSTTKRKVYTFPCLQADVKIPFLFLCSNSALSFPPALMHTWAEDFFFLLFIFFFLCFPSACIFFCFYTSLRKWTDFFVNCGAEGNVKN